MGTAAVVALAGCEPGPVVPRWLRRFFSRKLSVSAMPPCIVRREQMEGAYFVDERLNRSGIRSDPSDGSVKKGVPLQLALRVHEIRGKGCLPLAGAIVDIWHCDARASIRTCGNAPSTRAAKSSCAAIRRRTPTARSAFRRSFQAGIRAEPS